MKNRVHIIFLILLFSMLFLSLCCKDSPTKPTPTGTVKLTLDYAECKEIGLKLNFTDANQPRRYALLRDGVQITSGTLGNTEILIVDTTVLPGRDYTYLAQRLNDSKPYDSSTPFPVHSLDSTLHSIQWQVDTLGAQGVIRDVWVFDRNNAWVVGEIYLKDSTGKINMSDQYNGAKWDGKKWNLEKFYYTYQEQHYTTALMAIFAFDTNDVWVASTAPQHWNGTEWQDYSFTGIMNGWVHKIWGTSKSNIFMVGDNGSIARFNGSTWSKIPSNTTVDLEDIYGIDENHIWVTGTNGNYSNSVLLSYDGTSWKKYSEGEYYSSSVWTVNNRRLYLAGVSGIMTYDIQKEKYSGLIQTPNQYIMYCIGGTNVNDIFCTGANTEIIHFNGSTFYLYKDLQTKFSSDVYWIRIKVRSDIVIAGGGVWTGYNTAPVITRGYR